jgi:hypothetical protein
MIPPPTAVVEELIRSIETAIAGCSPVFGIPGNPVQIEISKRQLEHWRKSILALVAHPIGADWQPTPDAINALPEPVRRYIHDLETRCDPAGEVRELVIARDTIRSLEALVAHQEPDLRRWVKHDDDCSARVCFHCLQRHEGAIVSPYEHDFVPRDCTCGLDTVLARVASAPPDQDKAEA